MVRQPPGGRARTRPGQPRTGPDAPDSPDSPDTQPPRANGASERVLTEGGIWKSVRPAQFLQQCIGSWVLQAFVLVALLNHQFHRDEMLLENGLDVRPF